MLMPRIIPCLDVRDGRVVKGTRFKNLRDTGDPAECAARYAEQGADELVVLDISATLEGRRTRLETVRRVRAVLNVPLCVGGGVRGIEDAEALLANGADKVGINTAAVADPTLLSRLADRFGRQCVVLSIDAQRSAEGYRVVTHSGNQGTARLAAEWAVEAVGRGAGEILLTSHDRDGTREGYDLDLLAEVRAVVDVPVIASGGAASTAHMAAAIAAGADAVLAASIFHDGDLSVMEVKHQLRERGVEVRR